MRWRNGETPGPWRLLIFPTYRCNLECGYCSQALVDDPPELLKEVPDERLVRLVDEAAELGVREFSIGGGGEPMLRRKVVMDMIKRVRFHNMQGTLQTNGTAFRPEDLETLVKINWDYLSISVDGPDAATNDSIRYKGSFNRLAKHLHVLRDLKSKHHSQFPTVQLSVVVTSQNSLLLPDMVKFGKEMGVQRLYFQDLYVRHEGMDAYLVHPEHRQKIQEGAARAARLAQDYGIYTNVAEFKNVHPEGAPWQIPAPRAANDNSLAHITESVCFDPWLGLSIVSSGNAGPCCNFWEGHSTNIKDCSLKDVWFGPYMTEMRTRMLANRPPEPCIECQVELIRHNREVGAKVASLHAEHLRNRRGPAQMVAKVLHSMQRHGMRGGLQRGKEWLAIRRTLAHK
ncbi:MAG: radical SAM protein [Candidatus Hydrogenedentes bacterium]|nr:radical SAM protein [Candidatus Hydrogenedentota bacterium]